MTWKFLYAVIAKTDLSTVWAWHSNVDNWARFEGNAVESIALDGPFHAGTHITTKMPGQEPRVSTLIVVEPPTHTIIEMRLDDALLRFDWTFEALADNQTRMTQDILLDGPNAAAYVSLMEQHFAPNVGPGMEKIAKAMEEYKNR
jgi:hypothetical protein